jgi:hypothetical protein
MRWRWRPLPWAWCMCVSWQHAGVCFDGMAWHLLMLLLLRACHELQHCRGVDPAGPTMTASTHVPCSVHVPAVQDCEEPSVVCKGITWVVPSYLPVTACPRALQLGAACNPWLCS